MPVRREGVFHETKVKRYELVRDGVVTGGRRLVPVAEAQRLVREGCE